jgi:nucleoside-triphosphatase THEP1
VPIGPWLLLSSGLSAASSAIEEALAEGCRLIVVDEFGPLECRGEGLRPAVDSAVRAGRSLLLVVRQDLVSRVQELYGRLNLVPLPASEDA